MTLPFQPRRRALVLGAAALATVTVRPARADQAELQAAVRNFAGGAPVREGKVQIDIAPLVENGNAVPIAVDVASPMTPADHVTAIALFNERNPERNVAVFHLGPRCGRAAVATRMTGPAQTVFEGEIEL